MAIVGSGSQPRLAVISGAGPEAGIDVLQKILLQNRQNLGAGGYKSDRDAPYVVVFQIPGIGGPRGPRDLLETDGAPYRLVLDSMLDTIRKIQLLKLDRFCISCNTLHMLEGAIRECCSAEGVEAEFVSIVECVAEHLARSCDPSSQAPTVAVFGSLNVTGYDGSSPYTRLNRAKLSDGLRERLQKLLNRIKVDTDRKPEQALELESMLREVEADRYVLACSEFPLLLPYLSEAVLQEKAVIDPCMLLAERLLRDARPSPPAKRAKI